MASGMPMVATETTISGVGGPHELGQLPAGHLGEGHPVVDADEQGDGQIVGEGTSGRSTAWLPTVVA